MKWGRRRSESSRERCGPGPENSGSWPGSWHLLPWLLPTRAAGSSLEGDSSAPGPPGDMMALSSEPHACRSVPARLSWDQCPDLTSNQRQGQSYNKNELPAVTSTSRDTWTGDERPLQRGCPVAHRIRCSQWERDAGKVTLSPSMSFEIIPVVSFGSFNIL